MLNAHAIPSPLPTPRRRFARCVSPVLRAARQVAFLPGLSGQPLGQSSYWHGGKRLSVPALTASAKLSGQRCNAGHVKVRALLKAAQSSVFVHSVPQASRREEVGNCPLNSFVAAGLRHLQPRRFVEVNS